uniref:Shisa family member 3 n=1 Tax=Cyanistes caeruleus TaxID=156563 RepID=A0A8C0VNW2_CYACU
PLEAQGCFNKLPVQRSFCFVPAGTQGHDRVCGTGDARTPLSSVSQRPGTARREEEALGKQTLVWPQPPSLPPCVPGLVRPAEPIYVPFLIVGSIFIAFIIVGSLVAVYCCTCLRPKQPSQPIQFSLRSYQTETLPMILASTSFRTPSRQSSTATSSSSTGSSVRRFSFPRAEPGCLVASSPPPYTSGCFQTAHAVHLTQPSGFLVSPPYFGYPLQPEPALAGKSCSDFTQS